MTHVQTPASASGDAYIAYTHRFFRKWLPVYDLFALSIAPAYSAAARRVEARPGRNVLDLCTGTGQMALRLARQGATVTGVDITPEMLGKARYRTDDPTVRFELMDARQLDFPDRSFDATMLSFALHDMPRAVRIRVLREAARVTRERLVILDYDFPTRPVLHKALVGVIGLFETAYLKRFAAEGVAALLREVGLGEFETVRLHPFPFAIFVVRT